MRLILIIYITMIGCGTEESLRDFHETNPVFDGYVQTFSEHYEREITDDDVVIDFGDTDGFAGQCDYDKRQITINEDYWNAISDYKKEILIYHELGHCVLDLRGHDNEQIEVEGCTIPKSIMNESLLMNSYEENREYYLEELFNREN